MIHEYFEKRKKKERNVIEVSIEERKHVIRNMLKVSFTRLETLNNEDAHC